VLGQDDVLQDPILVHNLVNIVARWHLDWEGYRRFMTGADHPHRGWTLDHLNLFTKLEGDGLSLMYVEVDRVLATTRSLSSIDLTSTSLALASRLTHGHCDAMLRLGWVGVTIGRINNDWRITRCIITRISRVVAST